MQEQVYYDMTIIALNVIMCRARPAHRNLLESNPRPDYRRALFLALLSENVFTFGGAKRSGSNRECIKTKYFPIGMNAREPLWR